MLVIKRDGREVEFDREKIYQAVWSALGRTTSTWVESTSITDSVCDVLESKYPSTVTVETIQDVVEIILLSTGHYVAAREYISHRARKELLRDTRSVPVDVREAFASSKLYFPTAIQEFQFYDKYSRYSYDLGRRETWEESVQRVINYLYKLGGAALTSDEWIWLQRMILEMKAMPSMRLLAMAGPAVDRQGLSAYNCSAMPCLDLLCFSEAMTISLAGCGVGFSVESKYIDNFPTIKEPMNYLRTTEYTVEDSSEGWAAALLEGVSTWFDGGDLRFNYDNIRPAGAVLRTKGGRASGSSPLRECLSFMRKTIQSRAGDKLRSIDVHDMMCKVGDAAVAGAQRRTAMISLFDPDDYEMLHSKDGNFHEQNPQRWNANNSAVWPDRGVTDLELLLQLNTMMQAGNGEPGIISRANFEASKPLRRDSAEWLVNPCSEVVLRPFGLCNLSIAVARQDDDYLSLEEKVKAATIIGCIQSLITNFPGMRPEWKRNAIEERLLGVDITGQMDSPSSRDPEVKRKLRDKVLEVAERMSSRLDINMPAACTVVKPSGNSSQLLDCSSGLHARWAPYYIRNVRISAYSPLYKVLRDASTPMDPENGQAADSAATWVIHFPVKAPDNAITRHDVSALDQCETWLNNKINWTEHNPSITCTYKNDEIIDVIKWIADHRDVISGMAFLPSFDAEYDQLPYIEITQEEYEERARAFPEIDWSKIYQYEESDMTEAAQTLACMSGTCEI